MTTNHLTKILSAAEAVLFDFDGPICSVFDGYPAPRITKELREMARQSRDKLAPALEQASSPHDLLLAAVGELELAQQLEAALQKTELTAIETAQPTPDAAECVAACVSSGRLVAIVSNNYAKAVLEYLTRAGLSGRVSHVEGRNAADPTLMKPDPHLLERATSNLGVTPEVCVFVGDQVTDI